MSSITIKKIKKIEPIVKKCLKQVPIARDNDTILILKIWAYQNPKLREPNYPFVNFAALLIDEQYVSSETITRCRRKLQEKYPELRGEKWYKRHQEGDDTRNEIVDA